MRPWLVYSTEYQGRRKRREDSAVIPSYPLWPAFQKASLSHSRVGWAFQEVPKKKKIGENISSGFHGQRQHRKEAEGLRIPKFQRKVPCLFLPQAPIWGSHCYTVLCTFSQTPAPSIVLTILQCPNSLLDCLFLHVLLPVSSRPTHQASLCKSTT